MYELKPAKNSRHTYIYKDGEPVLLLSDVPFYGKYKDVLVELINLASKSLNDELKQDWG